MKKNIFRSRRFKYGSLATIITIGFLAALVLINVVATLLLERYPLSIDLTSEKKFQLTQESLDMLANINHDVTITVCDNEMEYRNNGDYGKLAYEVIRNYERNSDHITVQFVDLLENPGFAQNYPEEDLVSYDILIASDLRTQKVNSNSLFEIGTTSYGGSVYRSKAEQTLSSAIMYVTDDNPQTAILLEGQSSIDLSAYQTLLEANNIQTESKNLLTEELGSDAKLLILPQPDTDLTAEQVKKLEAFLDNDGQFGKSLVFIAGTATPIGPVLENFLAEWGLEVGPEMIYETNPSYMLSDYVAINIVSDSEVLDGITNTNLPLVMPYAHPVSTLFDEKDNRSTRVITESSPTSVLIPSDADSDLELADLEQQSYATIAVGERYMYVDNEPVYSYVMAIGSEMFIDEASLEMPSYGNSSVLVSATNNISSKGNALQILPVNMSPTAITITSAQVITYQIVLVVVIPVLRLAAGLIVWLRRRHL